MSNYKHKIIYATQFELINLFIFEDMTFQSYPPLKKGVSHQKCWYLPPENGFDFKKKKLYVQNCSNRPAIDPLLSNSTISKQDNFFHFHAKGPVKLTQWVKIAVCVKSVPLYYFKVSYVVLHMAVKIFRNPLKEMEKYAVLILKIIFNQP